MQAPDLVAIEAEVSAGLTYGIRGNVRFPSVPTTLKRNLGTEAAVTAELRRKSPPHTNDHACQRVNFKQPRFSGTLM
jgi:hypothetical protein